MTNHGKRITICQAEKVVEQMDFDEDGVIIYDDFLVVITARLLSIKLNC